MGRPVLGQVNIKAAILALRTRPPTTDRASALVNAWLISDPEPAPPQAQLWPPDNANAGVALVTETRCRYESLNAPFGPTGA
jgi:hypothetical protein